MARHAVPSSMRILHVHKYFHERDGASRYVSELMRETEARGHATAILAMDQPDNTRTPWSEFFVSNIETKRVKFGFGAFKQLERAFYSREAKKKMEEICESFRPDVVHAHNLYTHLSPSVLSVARKRGIPVVMTVHDYGLVSANYVIFDGREPMDPRSSVWAFARTRFIKGSFLATALLEVVLRLQRTLGFWQRGVDAYLCASHAVVHTLASVGFDKDRMHVLSLPAGPFTARLQEPDTSLSRKRQVVFASRFETYKGIDVVLEIAERLPDVEFVLVGFGNKMPLVRQAADRLKNIAIKEFVPGPDLWQLMEEAACVLVPSVWAEPYGLVAIEAMARGTPVMVGNRGGLPEIVQNGVSGMVENPDDPAAWAKRLKAFLGSEPVQRKMRAEALKRAHSLGEPKKHLEAVMALYNDVRSHKADL